MKIFDISIPINNKTVVYPNNVPVSISIHQDMPQSATKLSSITFGSHTGTHIDAPAHAIKGAKTLDLLPLDVFVGSCRVLDYSKEDGEAVTKNFLQEKKVKKGERILLKTKNSIKGFDVFYDDYIYLDGDAADYLSEVGVVLVGIDALSIKKRGSNDHRPHLSLLSKDIPIIEGLNLSEVEEGVYELVCLPLKFTGIDGSPARAILRSLM